MKQDAILKVIGISVGYDSNFVLRDCSLHAYPGDITCLLGSNGSGKSTLLKAIFGLMRVAKGRILFMGSDVTNASPRTKRLMGMSLMLQGGRVFPQLSVQENLRLAGSTATYRGISPEEKVVSVIKEIPELTPKYRTKAAFLSGGERQLLAFGMAMMIDSHLLLLDEPTANVSQRTAHSIFRKLQKLARQEERAIIVCEQNVALANEYSDRVYRVEKNKAFLDYTVEANHELS